MANDGMADDGGCALGDNHARGCAVPDDDRSVGVAGDLGAAAGPPDVYAVVDLEGGRQGQGENVTWAAHHLLQGRGGRSEGEVAEAEGKEEEEEEKEEEGEEETEKEMKN